MGSSPPWARTRVAKGSLCSQLSTPSSATVTLVSASADPGETSCFERMRFETPLDIKLRSDSLGRTILFLGYSLNDMNIRFLLYRLHQIWHESAYSSAQPRSFLVTDRPNKFKTSFSITGASRQSWPKTASRPPTASSIFFVTSAKRPSVLPSNALSGRGLIQVVHR
jgi:hypothetical protein